MRREAPPMVFAVYKTGLIRIANMRKLEDRFCMREL